MVTCQQSQGQRSEPLISPYRMFALSCLSGKDISQIRNVKSATGEVLMKDDESKERWGQYFNVLMNKENHRVEQKK